MQRVRFKNVIQYAVRFVYIKASNISLIYGTRQASFYAFTCYVARQVP